MEDKMFIRKKKILISISVSILAALLFLTSWQQGVGMEGN